MYSVLYFGLFYTTVKKKHAKFLGTSTLFVTKNHWICQLWRHLLLPTEQQTFVQPSVSIILSNLPLQFVSVWLIWCLSLCPSHPGTLFSLYPLLYSCFCVIPVLFTLQGEPGSAVGCFDGARAHWSHKDRREAVQPHSTSLSGHIVCTEPTKQLWLL